MTNTDASIYVVLLFQPGHCTAYVNRKRGQGRSARRELIATVYVPEPVRGDLTHVLEAVAAELRLPHAERWLPAPRGAGAPRGASGGLV